MLLTALRRKQPMLILGPPGAGKTKLIRTVLQDVTQAIYSRCPPVLHNFLIELATATATAGNPVLRHAVRGTADPRKWAATQSSVHLRGILWTALEQHPAILILDQINGAGHRTYRFLQRIYHAKGMTVVAASRDLRTLDDLARLFWDSRQMINLGPLNESESLELFDTITVQLGLRTLDLSQFRRQVLESAHGNPGQIVEMCKLAADPRYRYGEKLKFGLLRIDAMTKFLAS
jgi:hypothetical protein